MINLELVKTLDFLVRAFTNGCTNLKWIWPADCLLPEVTHPTNNTVKCCLNLSQIKIYMNIQESNQTLSKVEYLIARSDGYMIHTDQNYSTPVLSCLWGQVI